MGQAERIFFLPKTSPELYGQLAFGVRRAPAVYRVSPLPPVSFYSQMKAHFLSPFVPSVDVTRFAMRQVERSDDGIKRYSSQDPLIEVARDITKLANDYRSMNDHDAITSYISERSNLLSDISFGVVFFSNGTDYIRRDKSIIDLILRNIDFAASDPHILPKRKIHFPML